MGGLQIIHGDGGSDGEDAEPLIILYQSAFTTAEGEAEGTLIAQLVRDLLDQTPPADIHVVHGRIKDQIVAAAIFTRLTYAEDLRSVFLLSPMAVAPDHQRQGHGEALLRAALDHLRTNKVDVAITYGDPAYYKRVGFQPMTPQQAQPPLPLSMPFGWIGQNLHDGTVPQLTGPSACVAALNRPEIW